MTTQSITLPVQGVTCGGCVATLQRVLGGLPGVASVAVEPASGRTEVRYDPARTDRSAMVQAVQDAGYDVA
ncbi:heavy-metal-associated domain-containing protein [Verticiella sediminum]|uniref:Heavy-metal-associated domain-containing protein n=1 Tax=Verticiella sediminum TaxID=1247510 RepID=A0A556AYI0_9BURK|nr:heavy-metal-associated domain-containing protein [Verticiella sediminum]TSH97987.1 heavy-metal-associated domain-containing protein [Verticiella sediminum]